MEQYNPDTKPRAAKIDTLLIHAGRQSHAKGGDGVPTVCPIYASTTYLYPDAEALDQAFDSRGRYVYARQGNPNASGFEDTMARVEGGVGAVSFGSGMAAIHAALLSAGLAPGTKVVASQDLYGPTIGLLRSIFVPFGVELVLHDFSLPDTADFIRAEQPDVLYVETLSNPLVKVTDLEAVGAAACEVGAVSIVDSTFTPPCLVRPLEYNFDLVVHSATKYIGGHGDSTGGVVVSARKVLLDELRSKAILLGGMLSPFESHLLVRGLRTLSLRVERHCSNAQAVACFLEQHPSVARVFYPGLQSHAQHTLAARLFAHERYGGLLAFELKEQSREGAFRFMDALQLCLPATTLGDVFSQVSYPPLSSHRTLTAADRRKMGIMDGCIRMSVGLEDVEDIINDLDQALRS
jgi:cystathionine beta-lyase/cystathionine gamma-synthase